MTHLLKHPSGGHFPGHLRDAFVEAVEVMYYAYPDRDALEKARIAIDNWRTGRDEHYTLSQIFAALWNCTDILPGGDIALVQDMTDGYRPQTYAAAARALKRVLAAQCAPA